MSFDRYLYIGSESTLFPAENLFRKLSPILAIEAPCDTTQLSVYVNLFLLQISCHN